MIRAWLGPAERRLEGVRFRVEDDEQIAAREGRDVDETQVVLDVLVGDPPGEGDDITQVELHDDLVQGLLVGAVPDDEDVEVAALLPQLGGRLEEQVEALVVDEPADVADDRLACDAEALGELLIALAGGEA